MRTSWKLVLTAVASVVVTSTVMTTWDAHHHLSSDAAPAGRGDGSVWADPKPGTRALRSALGLTKPLLAATTNATPGNAIVTPKQPHRFEGVSVVDQQKALLEEIARDVRALVRSNDARYKATIRAPKPNPAAQAKPVGHKGAAAVAAKGPPPSSESAEPITRLAIAIPTAPRASKTVLPRMVQRIAAGAAADGLEIDILVQQSGNQTLLNASDVRLIEAAGAKVSVGPIHEQLMPGKKIPLTLKNPEDRVRWRTGHVLDYAALLETVLKGSEANVILVLEDDLLPARHLVKAFMESFEGVRATLKKYWGMISLYKTDTLAQRVAFPSVHQLPNQFCGVCGGVAWAFRRELVGHLVDYLRQNAFSRPVDTLLFKFIHSKRLKQYARLPSLVQHLGSVSTFKRNGKERERMRSNSFFRDEYNASTWTHKAIKPNGYMGCYHDKAEERDLNGLFDVSGERNTPWKCAQFCHRYRYFAMQFSYECYCGNDFGLHGKAPESDCQLPCAKASTTCSLTCGGRLASSVYETGVRFKMLDSGVRTLELNTTNDLPPVLLNRLAEGEACKG